MEKENEIKLQITLKPKPIKIHIETTKKKERKL